MRNIIFDYDGTLHESIYIYAPAFKRAYAYLVSIKEADEKEWKAEEISQWLGYSAKDMWNCFMPQLTEELREACSRIIGEEMVRLVAEGEARLYKDAIQTLEQLKKRGYNLIFLSNCKQEYMQAHKAYFHLENYFTDFYCTEAYDFRPKYEIFPYIKNRYPGTYIVIGDRSQDMELAWRWKLKFIGCGYGYGSGGELDRAGVIIEKITELNKLLKGVE